MGGSNYKIAWDSTSSVQAFTRLYYNEKGNPSTYLVTKAEGGIEYSDLAITIVSQSVRIGCNGAFPQYVDNQILSFSPTTRSFSRTTSFTKYVMPSYLGEVGVVYELTLRRNGNPWTFTIVNNITS